MASRVIAKKVITSLCHRQQHRALLHCRNLSQYEQVFKDSIKQPTEFWAEVSQNVTWFKPWEKVLDTTNHPPGHWFVGGELNTCYNAVDRHVVNGHGEQTAVIHDSPVTNSQTKLTYKELLKQVSLMADVLTKTGVEKGDRVVIYMPMIPEALVTMLACARIGAVHCLVFGGFAAKELSVRLSHCQPKAIVTASCGVEPTRVVAYVPIVEQALEMTPEHICPEVIIFNRPQLDKVELKPHQFCYQEEMDKARPMDCVPVDSLHPLYILYTSGTTGQPKGVVRSHGGHAVALTWSMSALYGLKPGEVWWSASDLGWVVGHSYICYAPLLHGNTTIIYEGKPVGTPDSSSFFRVLCEHNVASMFTAPTALRAIRKADPEAELGKKYKLPNFRNMFVAGEHCDVETARWTTESFGGSPVLDNWWQTETGWAITCTNVGLGNKVNPPEGFTGLPVPGYDVKVLKPDLTEANAGELGNIVVKLPLPPGFADTLYQNKPKYEEYFIKYPGYYDTADSGFCDKEGYVAVMARTDDIINVAGHRLSTSALEEAIMAEDEVAECAVVGIKDELKGQVPLGFCIMKHPVKDKEPMTNHIIAHVREVVGPVAAFKLVVFVPGLPKTRSGKIARATLAALADGRPYKVPPTIEDESVYEKIKTALEEIGLAKPQSDS